MDFAAMIAAAAATASEEAGAPMPGPSPSQHQHQQQMHQQHQSFAPQEPLPSVEGYQGGGGYQEAGEAAAEISSGFSADPHLYMRILSLPILESLVSGYARALIEAYGSGSVRMDGLTFL